MEQVEDLPTDYAALVKGRLGNERHPELTWNVAAYVSHVTDNLRNWAERLAGARLSGTRQVPGYNPDLLAQASSYNEVSLAGALWSLQLAADAWVDSVSAALEDNVVLEHAGRGIQRAEDVVRNNAHDAAHHAWDIERILTHADQSAAG
ncbi:DinB family protein [Streptomyces sp. NPDC046805]|uniref:DinB family protein n=1 Tax=Streptomyces sp. NPDC046805 TaxID=3155134 RepID=UPI0033E2ECDA